jgi:hypothetical protein
LCESRLNFVEIKICRVYDGFEFVFVELEIATLLIFFFSLHYYFITISPIFFHCCIKRRDFWSKLLIAFFSLLYKKT